MAEVKCHAKIRLSPPLQTSVEAVAGAVALLVAAAEQRSTNIEREQLDMLFKSMAISPLAKWTLHWSLVF
uniref:Uncharacterized protein n=1 Tax=Oryza glumipatula TaxID=40148 RepID=A0A0D9ZL31_9ORYZ